MIYPIEVYLERIENAYTTGKAHNVGINSIMRNLTDGIPVHDMPVSNRVIIASKILQTLSQQDRKELARCLLEEQVSEQRKKLNHWSTITAQSSQIDTGSSLLFLKFSRTK